MVKKALITGITGQDGRYLAKLLLQKGYEIYGLTRHDRTVDGAIKLIKGCLTDAESIKKALEISRPDEIYNLGAQSNANLSFQIPEETWDINYFGVRHLVRAAMKLNPRIKIYQASSAEMFGTTPPPQKESSPFNPISPYAETKTAAHRDYVVGYRERYGLFICSGILFNHESPLRNKEFVTRKITHALAKIKLGLQDHLELGNLAVKRDWGFAGDYVEAMWMILQQPEPEDFVIATGISHTVEQFAQLAADYLDMPITWREQGVHQIGINQQKKVIVKVNPSFFRPNEVHHLLGNPIKARKKLGWHSKVNFGQLVEMMVKSDLDLVAREHGIK